MVRYISLLLFIGLAWGQVEQDKLVLKDGTRYLGEFSTIDGENVLFKPEGAFGFQPITVKLIKQLQLKDGHYIIDIRSERQGGNVLCCVVVTGILVYVVMSSLKFNYSGGLWEPGQGTVVHIRLKEGM